MSTTTPPTRTPPSARPAGLLAFTAAQQPDRSWKLTTGTNTDHTHAFTRTTTNRAPG